MPMVNVFPRPLSAAPFTVNSPGMPRQPSIHQLDSRWPLPAQSLYFIKSPQLAWPSPSQSLDAIFLHRYLVMFNYPTCLPQCSQDRDWETDRCPLCRLPSLTPDHHPGQRTKVSQTHLILPFVLWWCRWKHYSWIKDLPAKLFPWEWCWVCWPWELFNVFFFLSLYSKIFPYTEVSRYNPVWICYIFITHIQKIEDNIQTTTNLHK